MKNIELSEDEAEALVRFLRRAIDDDRYPFSPRVPARAPLPPLKTYEPLSKGRYRRRA